MATGSDTTSVFSSDATALVDATPWTTKSFRNDPDNFQFAIIGDRAGEASAQGTVFEFAMDQIDPRLPDFVINAGPLTTNRR